jgi:peptidyl-prolyl cis-trans isomerase A (cyclophilin A)
VKTGYYDDVAFFRVISGFMVQSGIHGDPRVARRGAGPDPGRPSDPIEHARDGHLSTAGPGTRTTQMFINFKDNSFLDSQGFAPFGRVVEGMAVVDSLHSGYGEGAPRGMGPDQGRVQAEGNAYLRGSFPKLDFVKTARLTKP